MSDEKNTSNCELSERASRLNENGAHYFIAWLISAGRNKPEIRAEFERGLHVGNRSTLATVLEGER